MLTCNRTELYLVQDEHAEELAVGRSTSSPATEAANSGGALPSPRRGRGAAPLPRRRRARLARPRRGRDSRPGARRLRGRVARPVPRQALPAGAARRPPRPARDGDRRAPPRCPRRPQRSRSRCSTTSRAAGCSCSARARRASRRPATSSRAAPTSPSSRTGHLRTARTRTPAGCRGGRARRGRRRARACRRRRLGDERLGHVLDREPSRPRCARKGRPLLLVDLAVPRDLDPAINDLDGCFLYDVDDLEAVVAETISGRRSEPHARSGSWPRRPTVPRVAGVARRRSDDRVVRALAEEIRDSELAKAGERLSERERGTSSR